MSAPSHKRFSQKVRIRLIQRGMTVTKLASTLGKSRQAIHAVINGSRRYPIARQALLDLLDLN